jgi:hypothetical protein
MEQHDEPKVGAHQDQLEGGVVEAEERQEWLLSVIEVCFPGQMTSQAELFILIIWNDGSWALQHLAIATHTGVLTQRREKYCDVGVILG